MKDSFAHLAGHAPAYSLCRQFSGIFYMGFKRVDLIRGARIKMNKQEQQGTDKPDKASPAENRVAVKKE